MKDHKRQMSDFEFFDYEGMERHLNQMARKGWRLERMTRMFWHYRRTECKTLRYAVTYLPDASEFNPRPTEGQETFCDYCGQAGWTLAGSLEQIQVFCSELENPDPIETDEAVKLNTIHQAMKKLFLPYSIAQLLLCTVLFLQQVYTHRNSLVEVVSSAELAAVLIWPLVALFAGSRLLHYALWYCRSRRSTALGGRCAPLRPFWRRLSWAWAALILLLALWLLADVARMLPRGIGVWTVLSLVAVNSLIVAGFFGLQRLGRWMGWSRRANQAFSWIVCILLAVLLSPLTVFVLNTAKDLGAFSEPETETFTWTEEDGSTTWVWPLRHDPIPLTVEDLTDIRYEHYTYELRTRSSSPLASRLTAVQRAYPTGTEMPDLSYTLVTVRVPVLYGPCVEQYLNRYANWKSDCVFQPQDPEPWGADRAYRLWRNGEAENEYLVCWENRILLLEAGFPLTAAQMAVAAEKLGNGAVA